MNLTEDQILALAPDDSSIKSGKELANVSKWSNLGVNEKALWGECQGSGKNPYKTQVDLSTVAFKCSCPSRKFPCKHGLGILLLYNRQKQLFNLLDTPVWVKEWIDKREEKAEKKNESQEKPVDKEAQAKRAQQRQKKVEHGIEELQLVFKDIVRNGILNIPEKAHGLFDNLSKRMVDSQAPGLAFMVKELAEMNYFKENWHTPFLDQVVKIHLITSAFKAEEKLPPPIQEEVRSLIGFSKNNEELKQQEGVQDDWLILAKKTEQQDQLSVQKNWLLGLNSGSYALVIQFFVRSQMPDVNLTPGTVVNAELIYYKSPNPFRAIIKNVGKLIETSITESGFPNWTALLTYEKAQIQASPFGSEYIYFIRNLALSTYQNDYFLNDEQGIHIPLTTDEKTRIKILAITGGGRFDLVVLGLEGVYTPMAIIMNQTYYAL